MMAAMAPTTVATGAMTSRKTLPRRETRIWSPERDLTRARQLTPPPTDKPFQLPDFVLDVADSSISLATPFGQLGIALQGAGNLSLLV